MALARKYAPSKNEQAHILYSGKEKIPIITRYFCKNCSSAIKRGKESYCMNDEVYNAYAESYTRLAAVKDAFLNDKNLPLEIVIGNMLKESHRLAEDAHLFEYAIFTDFIKDILSVGNAPEQFKKEIKELGDYIMEIINLGMSALSCNNINKAYFIARMEHTINRYHQIVLKDNRFARRDPEILKYHE